MSDQVTGNDQGEIVPYAPDKPTLQMEMRGPQAAQAYEVAPQAVDATALPLNVIFTTSAEISGGAVLIDGAGAQFEAHVLGLQAVSVSKRTPDGAIVGDWLLQAPGVILSGPVSLSAAGNDLIVFLTGHANIGTKPRDNYRLAARIAGQYTAWPTHPGQGEGAYTEAAPAAPAPTAPDALTLAGLIDGLAHSHDLRALFGGLMQSAVNSAIVGPLDQWARDRVFEGSTESLRKAGLPPK